mmetsp:Transcript_26214/g.56219  ORF Transcript_26214/g.56219 Transcript_26214/m.56219 type:complete len:369 (+) Transcript_26214:280-1386(+)
MGDGVVGESADPGRLDETELGSKVGADHAQLHRGQDGDGESAESHGDTDQVVGEVVDQGEYPLGQVHQRQRLVELAVPHQKAMGNGGAAVGKGRNVDAVVAEGGQNQKGGLAQAVGGDHVGEVGPSDVHLKNGVAPGGGKDPPRVELFDHGDRAEGPEKVVAGPGVVAQVEVGGELSVSMPSLGVDNKVELDEGASLGVFLSRNVVDPVELAVVIEPEGVVHVNRLGFRRVLEVEVGPDHFVRGDTDQDAVQRGAREPPEGPVGVGCVKDGVAGDFLDGTDSRDVDLVHLDDGLDVEMVGGENLAEGRHDARIVFELGDLAVGSVLLVGPDVGGFRLFWNLLVDPFPEFLDGLLRGDFAKEVAVSRDK